MISVDTIIAQVKMLPPKEQALLLDRLNDEFGGEDSPEEVEAAWLEEIERRAEEVRSGKVQTIPSEDVHREIRKKYGLPE